MNFWTNLFNRRRTYIKPKKPQKPTPPKWNLQEQISLSKSITLLKRHKNQKIQHHKNQMNSKPNPKLC